MSPITDSEAKNTVTGVPIPTPAVEALFTVGTHIGYSKARQNPKMKEFIFGVRNNVEIFDLALTDKKLAEAEAFLKSLGREGKQVLWVGSKPSAKVHIEQVAQALGMPYVSLRWLGGTLTNMKIFEQRLSHWDRLEKELESGGFDKYVKKERLLKMVELRKLSRMFGGLKSMKSLPAALVVVDPAEEKTAVSEARRKKIPIIALLNSDCNPEGILHPIPGNDSVSSSIELILGRLRDAYKSGRSEKPETPIA